MNFKFSQKRCQIKNRSWSLRTMAHIFQFVWKNFWAKTPRNGSEIGMTGEDTRAAMGRISVKALGSESHKVQ